MNNQFEKAKTYAVFVRNWWTRNPAWPGGREPAAGRRTYLGHGYTYEGARARCEAYNSTHDPGFLSRKAEFESE